MNADKIKHHIVNSGITQSITRTTSHEDIIKVNPHHHNNISIHQRSSAVENNQKPPHGGRTLALAREHGFPPEQILDFSSTLHPTPPKLDDALWKKAKKRIAYYPEDNFDGATEILSEIYGIPREWILPVAGAIDGLRLVMSLYRGRRILAVEPGFSEYRWIAEAEGLEYHPLCMNPLASAEEMLESFSKTARTGDLLLLCRPHNPSGVTIPLDQLQTFLSASQHARNPCILDESLIEFTQDQAQNQSMAHSLADYPQVCLLRSMTKLWAIPGLRLGFIVSANAELRQLLMQRQLPWFMHSLAQAWLEHACCKDEYEQRIQTAAALYSSALDLAEQITMNPRWNTHLKGSSFFLIEIPETISMSTLEQALEAEGILVRFYEDEPASQLGRMIRVSARSPDENRSLLVALQKIPQDLFAHA